MVFHHDQENVVKVCMVRNFGKSRTGKGRDDQEIAVADLSPATLAALAGQVEAAVLQLTGQHDFAR